MEMNGCGWRPFGRVAWKRAALAAVLGLVAGLAPGVAAAVQECPADGGAAAERLLAAGQSSAARTLAERGCVPPDHRTATGGGLLAMAAMFGDLDMVDALVQQGHPVDDPVHPPLGHAFFGAVLGSAPPWRETRQRSRQVEVIVFLINSGAPVDIDLDGPGSRNFVPSLWNILCRKPSRIGDLILVESAWIRVRQPFRLERGSIPALQEKHAATHDPRCTARFVDTFAGVL